MSKAILFTESSSNVGGQELQLMQQMQQLAAAGYQPVLACRPGSRVEQVALQKGLSVGKKDLHIYQMFYRILILKKDY